MKYVLSYGGGVNSSALFFYLQEQKKPIDIMIFSDTGEESPETYNAVERMKAICKDRGVEFVTVQSHHGELYNYYFEKKAIMSIMHRDCTSKFKVSPIRRYIRERFGKKERFVMYIGIAFEEVGRMRTSDVKYIENSFPFCEDKIDREGNYKILERHGFEAQKSGCQGCIFQKKAEWVRLLKEQPEEYEKWVKLEENCSRFPEFTLFQGGSLRKLRKAVREQRTLFEFEESPQPTCDVASGCFL